MPPTRRNLFQSHLSRRPASGVSSNSTNANLSADTNTNNNTNNTNNHQINQFLPSPSPQTGLSLSPSHVPPSHVPPSTTTTTTPFDNGEIIARDKNGGFQLDIPVLPPIPLDGGQEDDEEEGDEPGDEDEGAMEGIERDGRPSATGSGGTGNNGSGDEEKLEADLVEMMYRNRNRHLGGDSEILNLIQQSLRTKVAALDEDNWMYEVEDDPRV